MGNTPQKPVKIHGENIGRSLRKRYREAAEPAWHDTGQHFHIQHRPRRFTHRHASEAGYQKRTAKYNREKLRKYGHTYPLVKTGDLRSRARSAQIKARGGTGQLGNQGGVQIIYKLRKLNFRPGGINLRDEFTRITTRETGELGRYFNTRFAPQFSAGN